MIKIDSVCHAGTCPRDNRTRQTVGLGCRAGRVLGCPDVPGTVG